MIVGFNCGTAQTGEQSGRIPPYRSPITCLAWSPDGVVVAAGTPDGSILLWDENSKQLRRIATEAGPIVCIAWAPNGKTLATGGSDRSIYLWDVVKPCRKNVLEGHTSPVTCLSFSYDGKLLASLGKDVRIWRCDNWETVASVRLSRSTRRAQADFLSEAKYSGSPR